MPNGPVTKVLRKGDTTKANPFTIIIVSNPVLEAPWNSGQFVADSVMSDQNAFDATAQYINTSLFGGLPNQSERFMADPSIASKIRVVSVFVPGRPVQDSNALVAQDGASNQLIARRAVFVPFLSGLGLQADVAYAISKSPTHTRATAWPASDDDARNGIAFTLDGITLAHRFFNLIPGTVALHTTSRSMTALHEFGHALSSFSNGVITDLYVDNDPALNNKRGRPIPSSFSTYNGANMASDQTRDGLGYGAWQSYHCELIAPTFPALMDNYWMASDNVPEHCQHDRLTRQFLLDRLRAKIGR